MAQARPRTRRQTGAAGGLPGWAMLTIGLIIGLFVAFLVYLDDLEDPPNAAVESVKPEQQDEPASADDEGNANRDDPRFEFYSILPELEVVVPEQGSGEPDAGTEGDDSATPEAAETQAQGQFYLQAGSFQQADQAERMKARIALLGLDVAIERVRIEGERWHRVRVGPYANREALQVAQQRLRDNDIDVLVLREKDSG